jgi:hypothetical protein
MVPLPIFITFNLYSNLENETKKADVVVEGGLSGVKAQPPGSRYRFRSQYKCGKCGKDKIAGKGHQCVLPSSHTNSTTPSAESHITPPAPPQAADDTSNSNQAAASSSIPPKSEPDAAGPSKPQWSNLIEACSGTIGELSGPVSTPVIASSTSTQDSCDLSEGQSDASDEAFPGHYKTGKNGQRFSRYRFRKQYKCGKCGEDKLQKHVCDPAKRSSYKQLLKETFSAAASRILKRY